MGRWTRLKGGPLALEPADRFATQRSLDWRAGLCPRDNASGGYQGKTSISGRGRPGLRATAWRAVWAALPAIAAGRTPLLQAE